MTMRETVESFLDEYSHEPAYFPRAFGPWQNEDDVDPRWLRGTLNAAARKGLIEIDKTDGKNWSWRFTLKATAKTESVDKNTR